VKGSETMVDSEQVFLCRDTIIREKGGKLDQVVIVEMIEEFIGESDGSGLITTIH
jgi:hypothetical protein